MESLSLYRFTLMDLSPLCIRDSCLVAGSVDFWGAVSLKVRGACNKDLLCI